MLRLFHNMTSHLAKWLMTSNTVSHVLKYTTKSNGTVGAIFMAFLKLYDSVQVIIVDTSSDSYAFLLALLLLTMVNDMFYKEVDEFYLNYLRKIDIFQIDLSNSYLQPDRLAIPKQV